MIVFTNGCFDVIHAGHIDLLQRARDMGSRLVVGLNSDESVRSIKGPDRPINTVGPRKAVLEALRSVDEVRVFDDLTPEKLINEIKPDVLVKGGDWKDNEIIGADFVSSYGGRVVSVPLVDGFSSTAMIEKLTETDRPHDRTGSEVTISLDQHLDTINAILSGDMTAIERCADLLVSTFATGKKVLICGNGGSAADAQHIAAEFVGRYEKERRALPSIALTTDTSALTALANDYDFERIFSRQVEALAAAGDCLIAISTSGNSPNVIAAVMAARKAGCTVIGMTGSKGKKLASLCDACILVPSERTARIQEAHITIAHIWCEIVENRINA